MQFSVDSFSLSLTYSTNPEDYNSDSGRAGNDPTTRMQSHLLGYLKIVRQHQFRILPCRPCFPLLSSPPGLFSLGFLVFHLKQAKFFWKHEPWCSNLMGYFFFCCGSAIFSRFILHCMCVNTVYFVVVGIALIVYQDNAIWYEMFWWWVDLRLLYWAFLIIVRFLHVEVVGIYYVELRFFLLFYNQDKAIWW